MTKTKIKTDFNLQNINQVLPEFALDAVQADLFHKLETTSNNYFVQGQAGTGKSTFIRHLKTHSKKKIRIACPTALAAIHIGGVTIHSLFQLPLKDFFIPEELELKRKTANILKKTDLLIIDEASMIRPDILDAIHILAQRARQSVLPFGGMQLLLIGDLCQLPPVIKSSTYPIFRAKYGHSESYFFDAKSYQTGQFETVFFTTVYRQQDNELVNHLVNLRHHRHLDKTVSFFNNQVNDTNTDYPNAITITPYKETAERINEERLNELSGQLFLYTAISQGSFLTQSETPAPHLLKLKVGTQIIFNKNNPPYWINGSTGIISECQEDCIWVHSTHNNRIVAVKRETWESYIYEYRKETDEVIEKLNGTFTQFPLQVGYALTIHKAQGKTLDRVMIDLSRGTFAHGQLYVALSRTRLFQDMRLKRPLTTQDVIMNNRVLLFLRSQSASQNRISSTIKNPDC